MRVFHCFLQDELSWNDVEEVRSFFGRIVKVAKNDGPALAREARPVLAVHNVQCSYWYS